MNPWIKAPAATPTTAAAAVAANSAEPTPSVGKDKEDAKTTTVTNTTTTTKTTIEEDKKPVEQTTTAKAAEKPTEPKVPKPETQKRPPVKDASQWPEPATAESKTPSAMDPVTTAATAAPMKKRSGPGSAPWAAVVNSEAALPSSSSSADAAADVNDSEVAQTVRKFCPNFEFRCIPIGIVSVYRQIETGLQAVVSTQLL